MYNVHLTDLSASKTHLSANAPTKRKIFMSGLYKQGHPKKRGDGVLDT
jgi:hypothetical protein